MDHLPAIDQPPAWRQRAAGRRLRCMLALALALHAAALLVPFPEPAPTAPPATLNLTLQPPALSEPAAISAPTGPAAEQSTVAARPAAPPDPASAPDPTSASVPAPPEPAMAAVNAAPPPALSAAVLFQLARELRWIEPDGPPRVPGEARLSGLPANLARPVLPSTPTRFAAHMLPLEAEVLDHWQEAGGVQRVVIRSTDGDTYCGRREAWDPLNPLFEPVMLFHRCGGGGRRKLTAAPPLRHEG